MDKADKTRKDHDAARTGSGAESAKASGSGAGSGQTRSPGEDAGRPVPFVSPARSPGADTGIGRPFGYLPLPAVMNQARPCPHAPEIGVHDWAGFEGAASWTWDDTQPSQIEHWPALRDCGVPMTFFLNPVFRADSRFEETWREAVCCGHELANHTWHHKDGGWTSTASVTELEAEIDSCSRYIMDEMGQSGVWTFAHPYGDLTWSKALGERFIAARSCKSGLVKSPAGDQNPLELPMHGVAAGDDAARHNSALDAALREKSWVILMFHAIRPTAHDWYAGAEISGILESLDYGKSGGRLWMDTFAAIAAYWRGQSIFLDTIPTRTHAGLELKWTLPQGFPPGCRLRLSAPGKTLFQEGKPVLPHNGGFHEISLDAGKVQMRPSRSGT